MSMRLIQFLRSGKSCAGRVRDAQWIEPLAFSTVYEAARAAIAADLPLTQIIESTATGESVSYEELVQTKCLLPPLTHPDPARLLISGTGLTHLGSAQSRAAMHASTHRDAELTDSMKLFREGLEGGKPAVGIGVQPEWFYKGDGRTVIAPEQSFLVPDFVADTGEEPELVGLYVVSDDGRVYRIGFALGNDLSDHITERHNYLWLAHSKLRPCCFGPELLVDDLPEDIQGQVRIIRQGQVVWERSFLTGESNMSHSIKNLEHHHFKYTRFRQPGDAHAHFFGTATLSFNDGVQTQEGDRFEIEHPSFGRPLRNTLSVEKCDGEVIVRRL
jgi:hypothetical protein